MHVLERAVRFNTFIISHQSSSSSSSMACDDGVGEVPRRFMIMGLGCYLHADYPLSEDRKRTIHVP